MSWCEPPTLRDVAAPGRLQAAWDHVRRRAAGPGIDRVTVRTWEVGASERIERLSRAIAEGRYQPRPALRVRLRETGRELAIPCVGDRVVQRALALALTPFYERTLSAAAYAYRPGRSVAMALEEVERHLGLGRRFFVRTDVRKFFDRIDRDRLQAALRADGLPPPLLRLIARVLRAGVREGAHVFDPGEGCAQGSALSPLLSNVYMRPVDEAMEAGGFAYIRYADDILLLAPDEASARDAGSELAVQVEAVGLRLHGGKTRRGHVGGGMDYLGVRFDAAGRGLSAVATARLEALAEARVSDPGALAALLTEWTAWYGPLAPSRVQGLPLLVGAVAMALTEDAAETLGALAERRLGLSDLEPRPAALHVWLAEAWVVCDEAVGVRAAALDAALAVRRDPTCAERARIAEALSIPEQVVGALGSAPRVAAAALGRVGALELAAAFRALGEPAAELGGGGPSEAIDEALLEGLLVRLGGRHGVHALEGLDRRGHQRFVQVDRPLGVEQARTHLSGGGRRGIFVAREDGTVCCATMSVWVRRQALLEGREGLKGFDARERWRTLEGQCHDHAAAFLREADRLGLAAHLEASDRFGRRVWLFFDRPVQLRHARAVLVRLESGVGNAPPELGRTATPAIDRVRRGMGPLVSLPLGRDPKTGKMGRWLGRCGGGVSDELRALGEAAHASRRRVHGLVRRGPVHRGGRAAKLTRALAPLEPWPGCLQVLRGCAMLRALATKAHRLGILEGIERATLYEALVHLPRVERAPALATILQPAGDQRGAVERRVVRATDHPIACPSIRRRHVGLAREVGCACHFQDLGKGVYPTPVLHTLRAEQVPIFREARRARRARKPAPPTPISPGAEEPAGETSLPLDRRACLQAFRKLENSRRQVADATRGMIRAEGALRLLFEATGLERLPVDGGWLIRLQADPPRYEIRLDPGAAAPDDPRVDTKVDL